MAFWLAVAGTASGWLAALVAYRRYRTDAKEAEDKRKDDLSAVVNDRLRVLMSTYDSVFEERETQAKSVLARMEELNQEKIAWLTERTALLNRVWELETGLRRCQTELDGLRGA